MNRTISKVTLAVAVALAGLVCTPQVALSEPVFRNGDRIVFLGDSITEQRAYSRYVMGYIALRYPNADVTFRNAGWGGDTAPGGRARLQRDVLSLKPQVVTICYGMNDGRYQPLTKENRDAFTAGMSGLVSDLKNAGVKVVLLAPGCADTSRSGFGYPYKAYNDNLAVLADDVKSLAARERVPVYDLYSLMLQTQNKGKAADPQFYMIPDGIHPGYSGHAVMAYGFINALGCQVTPSSLEIDAAKSAVVPDRCTVNKLRIRPDAVSFVRKDDALPAYFYLDVADIVKYAPFLTEMNAYKFKITGLKPGTWKLNVQGMEVGKFSADSLAKGIDLSTYTGPWTKLSAQVDALARDQEDLYFTKWRGLQFLPLPAETNREAKALLNKMDLCIADTEAKRAKAVSQNTWTWSLALEP